jgi:parallel beta-helix repeat protein
VAIFYSGASGNIIGGTTAEARNVISGNDGGGVSLWNDVTGNLVQGNFIGTDITGTVDLGNGWNGVGIADASYNIIGGTTSGAGNIISGNDMTGVHITESNGNLVQGNSIFSNGGLGIDLGGDGVTPNDAGDGDTGANNLQNFPVLTSATSGSTNIEGTLNSTPNTEFRLEFFASSACDPSGYGESKTFLGFTNVTTGGSGDISFTVTFPATVPVGYVITATATDPDGNTSEFSQCTPVQSPPPPPPVGGTIIPIDKVGLVMPRIIVATVIVVIIVALVIWKRKLPKLQSQ